MEQSQLKEITLKSGAVLSIGNTPFEESKALFQAALKAIQAVKLSSDEIMMNVFKNLCAAGFTDPATEKAMWVCLGRCLYNGSKISPTTFEPAEARADFIEVCLEVGQENIEPFMNGLYAKSSQVFQIIGNILKS